MKFAHNLGFIIGRIIMTLTVTPVVNVFNAAQMFWLGLTSAFDFELTNETKSNIGNLCVILLYISIIFTLIFTVATSGVRP